MNKIILLIDSLGSGGAQRQILLLAKLLAETGCQVEVLIYHDIIDYEVNDNKFKITLIKKGKPWVFIWKFLAYIRMSKPDTLIAYLRGPTLIARLAKIFSPNLQVITSQRNVDLHHMKKNLLLEKLTYRLSDKIVTNTYSEQAMLIDKVNIPRSKIQVIYNGYDEKRFFPVLEKQRSEIRAQLGVSFEQFCIVLPGRIQQQKNHQCLIEALSGIEHKDKLKVFFVGDVIDLDLAQILKVAIDKNLLNENIIFTGRQENIEEYYHAADLVVLPSLWEGLPNVILEAMACARTVIASNVADNSQIIEHGINGFLFDSNSTAQLTTLLNNIILNGVSMEVGSKASEYAAKKFSSSELGVNYLNCIERLTR